MKEPEKTIKVTTLIVPAEKWRVEVGSATIVIDVLRATTSIVVALSFGATAVHPVASIPSARKLARSLPGSPLLAGERDGLRIPGFDLGNSPLEFQSPVVRNHPIVMCTTNGTRAVKRIVGNDHQLYTAALVNLTAATRIARRYHNVCLACSGKEGRFSLEDAFCAGGIISLLGSKQAIMLDDAGLACRQIWNSHKNNPVKLLQTCNHGIYLESLGMGSDLEFCAQLDVYNAVPHLRGSTLQLD